LETPLAQPYAPISYPGRSSEILSDLTNEELRKREAQDPADGTVKGELGYATAHWWYTSFIEINEESFQGVLNAEVYRAKLNTENGWINVVDTTWVGDLFGQRRWKEIAVWGQASDES
jgi:hypothetical protein